MHTRINLSYVTPLLPVRPFRALPLSTRVKPIVTLRSPTKRRVRTSPLAVIDKESQTSSSTLLDVPREAWTAEGRPLITHSTKHPPGKFPLALELDYVLNHPITEGIIALLVSLNCLAFALQTLDVGPQLHQAFRSYESNLTVLFLIEYVARWYGKGFSPKYLLTRGMILDFIAVSPLAFAVADQSEALFVRILRLSRILRIRSLFLDSERGQEIMESMSFAQIRLANVVLTLFSLLYVSAGLFYQVEKDVNPAVQNFFDAFYFSIITLFTVGFGDITPLTSAGKASMCFRIPLRASSTLTFHPSRTSYTLT